VPHAAPVLGGQNDLICIAGQELAGDLQLDEALRAEGI
jgi:hypothetical protein